MKNLQVTFVIALTLLLTANANGQTKPITTQSGFIENKGQIIDQNNLPNKEVLYLYNGPGLHVQLKQSGFSYEVIKTVSKPIVRTESEPEFSADKFEEPEDVTFFIHRIDISFIGANDKAEIVAYGRVPDYVNYYTTGTSEAGVTNVHRYKKVLYRNIYPNIDIEFLLTNEKQYGRFKYNILVHPGGNPNDITMQFAGANQTSLTGDGNILIETAYGNIEEQIPHSYQLLANGKEQEVHAKFIFARLPNTFGISIKEYNPVRTLVIDPAPWATYFGGSDEDRAYATATDLNGNVIVSGYTLSTSSIATSGAFQTTIGGSIDAFIAKFKPGGSLQWATYLGSTGDDYALGAGTDAGGNVFINGRTTSTSGITSSGAWKTTYGGGFRDVMIAMFDTAGARQWTTYYGGTSNEGGYGMAMDKSGGVLITGYTYSGTGIASSGAYQTTLGGNSDAFVANFNAAGSQVWATYFGGSGVDIALGITRDTSGNIFITGETVSTSAIASTGAFQTTFGGGATEGDAYIAKFNSGGSHQWSTYFGGSGNESGNEIATDKAGNVVITGFVETSSTLASSGAWQTTLGGNYDAFIAKFNPGGSRVWSTYYGGTANDYSSGIATDPSGNIVIAGYAASSSSIASSGSYQSSYAGGYDAIIAKFNPGGSRIWATYFGGSGADFAIAMALDAAGNIAIAGNTASTSSVTTSGAYQTTFAGAVDVLIACFSGGGGLLTVQSNTISGAQTICRGTTPSTITGSTPTGGNGTFKYSWLISTISEYTGYAVAGINDTTKNYSHLPVTNTWYKRVVSSLGVFDTSAAIAISVKPKPIPGFTINKPSQCFNGNAFTFSDTSGFTSGTFSRKWNFGNGPGDTASSLNPNKNYTAAGIYTVKLVLTGSNGCNDSLSKTVYVHQNPKIGFSINNVSQCINGNSFTFNDTSKISSGILIRTWNFGTGPTDTSTSFSQVKTYLAAGTYSIQLILNNNGCIDSLTKTVSVNPLPFANAGFDQIICNRANTSIGANAVSGNTFSWTSSPNGFTSIAANPTVNPNTTTTYYLTETITATGCSKSDSVKVTVNPLPAANAGSYHAICLGANTSIGASTVSGNTYSWTSSPGGFISASANPIINPTATTTYYLVETIPATACSESDSVKITVNPLPAANAGSNHSICNGENAYIGDWPISGNSYSWTSDPSGFTSTFSLYMVNPSVTTTFYLTETIDSTGCSRSDSVKTTVNPLPAAIAGTDRTICNGESVIIGASAVSGNSYSWTSTPGGFISSSADPVVSPGINTTYYLTETITSTGCLKSDSVTITVKPLPVVTTILSGVTITADQIGAAYQWLDCNSGFSPIANATNQSFTAIASGDYAVEVTLNSCSDTSACVSLANVGIEQKTKDNDGLIVYPNPSNGSFTVQSTREGSYLMINAMGQIIHEFDLTALNDYQVHIENLGSGVYFIVGFNNNILGRQKVIVTR